MKSIIKYFEENPHVEDHTFKINGYDVYVERMENRLLWLEYNKNNEPTGKTKVIGGYVCQLSTLEQKVIKKRVIKALKELGYTGQELKELTQEAMESKLHDLTELIG